MYPVCDVAAVIRRIPIEELQELVNEPLRKTAQILDFDRRRGSVTNDEIMTYLSDDYGLGASIRQLSKLTGFSERIVRNA